MALTSLNNPGAQLISDKDGVIIVNDFADVTGGRSLNVEGFEPEVIRQGHVIIQDTTSLEYKPLGATEASKSGVTAVGTLVGGTGYASAGTYENVPLNGGSGTGAKATVTTAGGVVTVLTITTKGNGYKVGDVLTFYNDFVGGSGSGASRPVSTVGDTAGAYDALPAGHAYAGIWKATVMKNRAMGGILRQGTVNWKACYYDMTGILTAVRAALPLIDFVQD